MTIMIMYIQLPAESAVNALRALRLYHSCGPMMRMTVPLKFPAQLPAYISCGSFLLRSDAGGEVHLVDETTIEVVTLQWLIALPLRHQSLQCCRHHGMCFLPQHFPHVCNSQSHLGFILKADGLTHSANILLQFGNEEILPVSHCTGL